MVPVGDVAVSVETPIHGGCRRVGSERLFWWALPAANYTPRISVESSGPGGIRGAKREQATHRIRAYVCVC